MRLNLAQALMCRSDVLLLDEPTNHLDLEMRHALSVALQEYQGAIVVVSHDRHLLRSVTDQLLLVADGKILPFDGDLDDYKQWLAEQKKGNDEPESTPASNVNLSRKDQRKQDAERRQRLKPLLDAVKKAETAVEKYHKAQQELEQQLADPAIYGEENKEQLKKLLSQKAQVDGALEQAELDWMTAEENLSQAE
jgi:ATP-binding cassette subfamily F protein 3